MKHSKIIIKTFTIILSLILLVSCVNNGSSGIKQSSGLNEANSVESESMMSWDIVDGKKVVTDCLGRTVEIPDQINKIASMHIYGVKMIFAMRMEDHAAFQLGIGEDFPPYAELDHFYASLPSSPALRNGSTITESLIARGVNLVLANANNGPEEADAYTNAGIPAITIRGETFEEVYETAEMLGFIFDKQERAEEFISFIKEKVAIVNSRVQDLDDADKPVILISGSGGVFTCASKGMFQNEMIEMAGGINAGKDIEGTKWARISAEDIILWDPDYIVLSNSMSEEDRLGVLNNETLQTVSAVKNGNVFIFPSTLGWWDFPLPQSILGINWLATIINPDAFSDINMLDLANEVYEFLYGYSYTELGGEL